MDLSSLLEQVALVAKGAGALLTAEGQFDLFVKEGHANFVTSTDLASQAYLERHLKELLPQANFVAEEQEGLFLAPGYNWIVDPLDGTTNYLHGMRHSAVSIALVQDGEGLLGVVYNPFSQELFTAFQDGGAFLNGHTIRVSHRTLEDGLFFFGTSPYNIRLAQPTFDAAARLFLASNDVRRMGSAALDLCSVAAGRSEGFFELILSPWDYAAAGIILTQAGGIIGAIPPHQWGYSRPIGICAANPLCYQPLLDLVTKGQ